MKQIWQALRQALTAKLEAGEPAEILYCAVDSEARRMLSANAICALEVHVRMLPEWHIPEVRALLERTILLLVQIQCPDVVSVKLVDSAEVNVHQAQLKKAASGAASPLTANPLGLESKYVISCHSAQRQIEIVSPIRVPTEFERNHTAIQSLSDSQLLARLATSGKDWLPGESYEIGRQWWIMVELDRND